MFHFSCKKKCKRNIKIYPGPKSKVLVDIYSLFKQNDIKSCYILSGDANESDENSQKNK